jgi:hypothetical protein
MSKTNTAEKINTIEIEEWSYLATEVAKVFKLNIKEAKELYNSKTARIIATIPFVAGCNEPERTAIAHLCIYEAEIKGFQKYFSHLPSDDVDIFNRLKFISTFDGGKKTIIEHGMYILACIMLEGYNRSKDKDLKNSIYNPVANGKWNYKTIKKKIMKKINEFECPELDKNIIPRVAEWK